MTQQSQPTWDSTHRSTSAPGTGANTGWVTGGVAFAGVLMLLTGVLAIFEGISAIAKDDVYTLVGDYVYKINLTGWGWILLIVGVVGVVVGAGVLKGAAWARIAGIALAALSIIFHFMFLPYQPVWSVIVIAIDIFVIWALAAYQPRGRDRTA
ncbi:hypothetical protein ACFV0T_28430 [Streptomyces sp. NPDC059582]|uniref:DUF7144 family membrane protein n=1 Tax=Streptomyces sp. NPDC059582 TaxID=3346875 RepID=UPI003674E4B6